MLLRKLIQGELYMQCSSFSDTGSQTSYLSEQIDSDHDNVQDQANGEAGKNISDG